ncbi:hypothetical protein Pfo_027496 [Paulownia fortunei]|nr:hypothetical protein Pfo_027496 [Paulownia fortunei]
MQEMGLWTLLEGCLLLANALAILNEDRFLAPRGWSFQEYSGVKRNSFKGQILGVVFIDTLKGIADSVRFFQEDVSLETRTICLKQDVHPTNFP